MEPGSQWERVYEKPTGTEFKNAELAESLRGGKYTYNEDELNIIKLKSPDLNYNVFIKVESGVKSTEPVTSNRNTKSN
jgi:hypothetical protein